MNKTQTLSTLDITYIGLFAALICISSWIHISIMAVPFTLQTFAVFTALGLLGGKRGTLCVVVYILLGAVGLPVFSGFSGGIGKLLGSTGGYISGFVFASLLIWLITHYFGTSIPVLTISMFLGLIVCYAFGTLWFILVYFKKGSVIELGSVLGLCVFPFIIPDLLKIALAIWVTKHMRILI